MHALLTHRNDKGDARGLNTFGQVVESLLVQHDTEVRHRDLAHTARAFEESRHARPRHQILQDPALQRAHLVPAHRVIKLGGLVVLAHPVTHDLVPVQREIDPLS